MRNTRDVHDDSPAVDEITEVDVTDSEVGDTQVGDADVEVADSEVIETSEVEVTDTDVTETPDDMVDDAIGGTASSEITDEITDESATDSAEAPDTSPEAARTMIDPRGARFGAAITVVVLALVLLTIPSVFAVVLLVWQAVAFGAAAFFGIQAQPYGMLYRSSVAPRLGPPSELEDAAPPRFAQQVGLVFVLVALVGLAFGLPVVAYVATAFALAAAFLNAAFNFCLGCEIYLLAQRFRRA